jgi:hypothetical protein
VIQKSFYEIPSNESERLGQQVYREFLTNAIVLTKNFRQRLDTTGFADICMRLREGILLDEDIAALNERYKPDKFDAIKSMPVGGAFLAGTKKAVSEVADFLIANAINENATVYTAWAQHRELSAGLPSPRRPLEQERREENQSTPRSRQLPPDFANLPWGDELRTGLLRLEPDEVSSLEQATIGPRFIELVIGKKYLITQNIFQKLNLVNGECISMYSPLLSYLVWLLNRVRSGLIAYRYHRNSGWIAVFKTLNR